MCCPLQAALKKYQMEHKSKGESLEKCQAELKKLRRKSQGSKHPSKYGDKEMQVSVRADDVCRSMRCFQSILLAGAGVEVVIDVVLAIIEELYYTGLFNWLQRTCQLVCRGAIY